MKQKADRRKFLKNSVLLGAAVAGAPLLNSCSGSGGNPVLSPTGTETAMAIVTGTDYEKAARLAVTALGGLHRFVPKGAKVAILANAQRNNPGVFTRPLIVKTIIQMCLEQGAADVACLSWLPLRNWDDTGLTAAVTEAGGRLLLADNKNEALFKTVPVPRGKALKEARIMNEFFNYDVLINMPITKDHAGNRFTGTLKNLMGLNSPLSNRTFHKPDWTSNPDAVKHLDQCIADLNTIITPALCIVDATEFIITNGPFGPGKLHAPHKVVAGTDRVALDAYCCTLWGLSPTDIIMINEAAAHNLGRMDFSKLARIEGEV